MLVQKRREERGIVRLNYQLTARCDLQKATDLPLVSMREYHVCPLLPWTGSLERKDLWDGRLFDA